MPPSRDDQPSESGTVAGPGAQEYNDRCATAGGIYIGVGYRAESRECAHGSADGRRVEIGNAAGSADDEDGAVLRSVEKVGKAPLCRASVVAKGRRVILSCTYMSNLSVSGMDQWVDRWMASPPEDFSCLAVLGRSTAACNTIVYAG